MEIGKLYQTNQYYWMLYPSIADAASGRAAASAGRTASAATGASAAVANWADYWSRELGCSVSYMSPKDIFMLLEKDGMLSKVLSTEGNIGWIILSQWCKDDIVEVTQ